MIIEASDNRGINTKYTNATVIINVERNQPPFFVSNNFGFAVSENTALGVSLSSVRAQDNDLIGNIVYTVLGDSYTPGYFTVNPNTGAISAVSNLRLDSRIQYTVCRLICSLILITFLKRYPLSYLSFIFMK